MSKHDKIAKLKEYIKNFVIKELEKEVKELKKLSHPQAEFICVECGCKAKRITKKGEK